MSHSHPGSELSVEQLVHALVQANPNSPSRRNLLGLEPQKVFGIEQDLCDILEATRTIVNRLTPINGLPPEILSRVLEHRDRDRDLVAATHVCRYWRSALVSSPSLWTCFRFQPNHDLDRTLTYLERSKSTPIDIDIDLGPRSPQDFEVYKCLAPHIARTRSFLISGPPEDVHTISLLFRNPAPSLQHLNLKVCTQDSPARLPDDFLGRHTPSLRSVSFSGICPTFESPFPLPNLTKFTLLLRDSAGPLRMSGLFRFLSSSPRLREVSINTSNKTLQDITPDKVISLESLEELEWHCFRWAGRILPYLRLPRLDWLDVALRFQANKVEKLADFLPSDHRLAGATEMTYLSGPFEEHVEFDGEGPGAKLCMRYTEADPAPIDWFSNTPRILFRHINDLAVGCHSNAVYFPIDAFENLDILIVLESDELFIEALFHSLSPGAGIPCPSLRQIRYYTRGSLNSVTNLAQARLQAGCRLELVRLSRSREDDEDRVSELREFVGEVLIE